MALKLKEINTITVEEYENISKLNIEDKHKCIILVHYVLKAINKYEELRILLSSDKRLWHISMTMQQLSMFFWFKALNLSFELY